MSTKQNKTKVLQVRLTQEDFDYLVKASYAMGTDASKLVRQLVQMSINAVKTAELEAEKIKQEEATRKQRDLLLAEMRKDKSDVEVTVNENEQTV